SYKALIGGSSGNFFIGKNDKTSGIGVQDSEFKIISSTSDAWNGEWHFLCFVSYESYENNKIIKKNKLFVDATQIGSTTNFSGGTGDIYIAHENESDGYYFKGLIDEVKFYNKELNETEIKTLFDSSAINCDPDCYEAGKKSVKRGDYNDNEKIDLGDAIGILQELTTSSTKYQLTSCKAILDNGISKGDGIYTIDPDGQGNIEPFDVFCDMSSDGGGWTKIEYKMDLELKNHFNDEGDKSRYLSNNFETVLSTDKILAIQKVSTEGKQQYVGECKNVIHYLYEAAETDKYRHAFGYKFIDNTESFSQRQDYTDPNNPNLIIQVLEDGCKENDDVLRSTSVMIKSVKVPLINVKSSDNGDSTDEFGSQLTKNPAWLR
ncbi:Disintegrin, partial [Candidatus Magnetomorum sp. HK-1]